MLENTTSPESHTTKAALWRWIGRLLQIAVARCGNEPVALDRGEKIRNRHSFGGETEEIWE